MVRGWVGCIDRSSRKVYIKDLLPGVRVYVEVKWLLGVPRGELFGRENDERAYELVDIK